MKPITEDERASLVEQVRLGRMGNDSNPQACLFDIDDIEALLQSEAYWREMWTIVREAGTARGQR